MKHNLSPEKNLNASSKAMNDIDIGKTTNKGIFIIYVNNCKIK